MTLDAVRALVAAEALGARLISVEGPGPGASAVVDGSGRLLAGDLTEATRPDVVADVLELISRERSATLDYDDCALFIEPIVPRPVLTIFGAVHVAQSLSTLARHLGYRVVVSDSRPAFISTDRFPDADELLPGWPDQVADRIVVDHRSYIVVLSHDARFEDPLWPLVLGTPVRYIGAMGSGKTAAARRRRLLDAGYEEPQVDRIRGPIGLDIGAVTAGEMAIGILAEMTMARYRTGDPAELHGRVRRMARD